MQILLIWVWLNFPQIPWTTLDFISSNGSVGRTSSVALLIISNSHNQKLFTNLTMLELRYHFHLTFCRNKGYLWALLCWSITMFPLQTECSFTLLSQTAFLFYILLYALMIELMNVHVCIYIVNGYVFVWKCKLCLPVFVWWTCVVFVYIYEHMYCLITCLDGPMENRFNTYWVTIFK